MLHICCISRLNAFWDPSCHQSIALNIVDIHNILFILCHVHTLQHYHRILYWFLLPMMKSALCCISISSFVTHACVRCSNIFLHSKTFCVFPKIISNLFRTMPFVHLAVNGNGNIYSCGDIAISNYLECVMSSAIHRRPESLCYEHRCSPNCYTYCG